MRIHYGPGYRMYYTRTAQTIYFLLLGGSKSTQKRDIKRAIENVAKARGIGEVARTTGLGRESLYKSLAPGAKPRYDTIVKVVKSLGVRLAVVPTPG